MLQVVAAASVLPILGAVASAETVFPGATWATKTPAELGLDQTRLIALSSYLGGHGCVVRSGYMVHTWGTQSTRADIASAAKPFVSHFLLEALEDGRIPSLDQTVNTWEPRLNSLNASDGYKDRGITWRHLANQTSCYGVPENPGTAFDYNDYQMALLWDTLFLNVYGTTYSDVDAKVLRPTLTHLIQCQDNPTFTGGRPGRVAVSVRDHARFGLLYLNAGNWNGEQVLRADLARMAVTSPLSNSIPRTTAIAAEMISGQRTYGSASIPDDQCDHEGSYSWLWWTNGVSRTGARKWPDVPNDAYGAFGHTNGKRAVVVVPSLALVAAWNDTTLDKKPGDPQAEAIRMLAGTVKGERAQ